MTLLDDLQALDLSAVIDAKADISVTINGDAMGSLVAQGGASAVLGDLGTVIATATAALDDPTALIGPITNALTAVLDEIGLDDVPLADYIEAVGTAARIVADIVAMLTGDPRAVGFSADGTTVGSALDRLGDTLGDHAAVVSGGLAEFRALIDTVERGLPSDPAALIGPALQILVPFGRDGIDAVASWAATIGGQLDRVAIDPDLTQGIIVALGNVRVAAQAGDATALAAALATLDQVRLNTVGQLAAALRGVMSVVSGIRIDDAVGVLGNLRQTLAAADETVFELLDGWRSMIATVRETVTEIDPTVAMEFFNGLLDDVEAAANDVLLSGVDASVEVVKQWLRDLLREVPLRSLRTQLSRAIAAAADAIADADLDGPIDTIRAPLREVAAVLADADPAALVQNAVTELEAVITAAIDDLADALGRITTAINDVAAGAQAVLGRAVDGLTSFRAVVDDITVSIENVGIIDAANEIAATLQSLREDVSQLLTAAPLPDALRQPIDQLVSTLESIDLDAAVGGPLRELAAQIQIPADVATTVRDGLDAVAEATAALVPDDVIADLESMMNDAVAQLEGLDVSQLTAGVTSVLDDAAGVFESVSVAELIAPAGEVFARIVQALDAVHPRVVLRPAIDLYGQILGAVSVPEPAAMAERAAAVTSQAGEAAARAAAEPARQALGDSPRMPPAGAPSTPRREEPPADLRPGDIVRLVGFLPNKLREALAGMSAGESDELLATLDALFGDAATGLRDVRDRASRLDATVSAALDAALAPVTAAQLDAQIALSGSAVVSAGGFDLDASFSIVASAGPTGLQGALGGELRLVGERCAQAQAGLSGTLAHDLDQVADLLDAVLPSDLLGDVDALLAALDPEPIAAEFDALLAAVVDATPAFLSAIDDEIVALEARVRGLVDTYNPGTLMQRFLGVLDVVREELALLDPGRLADELGEVHAQAKAAVLAYDPIVLAGELDALLAGAAAAVRGLDPSGLMPDLSGITAQVARVGDILPVNALAGVGAELEAVGTELRELDVAGMLDAVNAFTPELADGITLLIDTVRDELVALLESIRYSTTNTSLSVSVSASVEV